MANAAGRSTARVARIGTKSFTLGEEIWQGTRHCVRATATYAYMDYRRNVSVAIPEAARTALEGHLRAE